MPDRLPTDRVAQIRGRAREAADSILSTCWDEDSLPIDPYRIATELDVSAFTAEMPEGVSGFAKRGDDEIYVNEGHHVHRQRFTAAHELGHLLDSNDDAAYRIDRMRDAIAQQGTSEPEVFANEFAASLLMPEFAVRSLRSRGAGVTELARLFAVSRTAMQNRLDNLGLS